MRLSLREAGELTGVTPTTVWRWVAGGGLALDGASISNPAGGWLRVWIDREALRLFVMRRVVTGRWKRYNGRDSARLPAAFLALRTTTHWIADLNHLATAIAGEDGALGDMERWEEFQEAVLGDTLRAFGPSIAGGLRVHWREP